MRLTIGQLRRIIRESISHVFVEGELNRVRQAHSQPNELADLLGWDWYTLEASEKLAMGDLLRGVMLGFDDKDLEQMLLQLPAEKNFVAAKPGKTGIIGKVKLDTRQLVKKIKDNYTN